MVRQLSPELLKKATKEINEVPERIEEDLKYIKVWISKQPHLKCRTDDQWLLAFLRGCKYSLERTKEKLDNFYTMRPIVPELFANRDPFRPEIQDVLKTGQLVPLLNPKDPTFPMVYLIRGGVYDPSKVSVPNIFKMNYMTSDVLLNECDTLCVNGLMVLMDLSDVTVSHFMHMTPTIVKKCMTVFQESYPIRPQSIHYINTPPGFETMFNMFKAFLKEKLKKRLYVHNKDYEALYKYIPQEMLPDEFGGKAGSIDKLAADWKAKIESYSSWFKEDEAYCSNEKLRPGKPKTSDDLFGIEGSFRQLSFD